MLTGVVISSNHSYSSFRLKTRFRRQNDKNLNNFSDTTDMAWLENKNYRLMREILWQNVTFIQCQLIELSKLVFVAMVTALQVLFRTLHLSTNYQLQCFNDTWIIKNYVMKMPSLYPRTSFSNNKSRNLNKGHCSRIQFSSKRHDEFVTTFFKGLWTISVAFITVSRDTCTHRF